MDLGRGEVRSYLMLCEYSDRYMLREGRLPDEMRDWRVAGRRTFLLGFEGLGAATRTRRVWKVVMGFWC